MLPAASWIVAVSTRVAPEVRFAVEPVRAISRGRAVDDGEGAERAGRQPGRVASIVTEPASAPVIVFVATPAGGGCVAGAGDGAGARLLPEGDHGRAVGRDRVPCRVLDVAVSTRVRLT